MVGFTQRLAKELWDYYPNGEVPRQHLGKILAQGFHKSAPQIRNLIQTGEEAGVWQREPGHGQDQWTVRLTRDAPATTQNTTTDP